MRAFLLGGSVASRSRTGALLRGAEALLVERGVRVERWDLRDRPLAPLDADEYRLPVRKRSEPGRALVRAAARADAIVIASPLYHSSYSGALKNALDHLSAQELCGKPLALLGNCGRVPSAQALDHLRIVARALTAIVIPTQLVTADSDWTSADGGWALRAPRASARLAETIDELLALTELLAPALGSGDSSEYASQVLQVGMP